MTETIDTANLRALAEAATPGPWIGAGPSFGAPLPAYLNEVVTDHQNEDEDDVTIVMAEHGAEDENTANISFVAAANPAAILALLDRLAAAEARNATLTPLAARYRWLRDRANNVAVRAPLVLMVDQSFANIQWHDTRYGAGLDAELDAVMAKDRAAASISTNGGGHG